MWPPRPPRVQPLKPCIVATGQTRQGGNIDISTSPFTGVSLIIDNQLRIIELGFKDSSHEFSHSQIVFLVPLQESQAKAQANIWLVLVGASSQLKDQITAFSKAMNVLQAAMQPEVVEVRMQFADWLLRSGFPISDALEQLGAASDLLLEIEEGSEDEEEDEGGADARYYSGLADRGDNDSDDGGSSVAPSDWDRSQSNFGSKKGSRAGSRIGSSRAGSMAGSRASRKSGSKAGSKAGSQSSRMSKRKKSSKKKLGRVKL